MTAPSTLKPSALVAAAHIIASDGPGEVVRKLDAAFDAAVAHRSDLPSGAASLGTYRNVDDSATYTWGRCDDGYFRFDQFGWATWPTQEGFSRALLLAAAPQAQAHEAPAALQQGFRPGKPAADVEVAWLLMRSRAGDGEGGSDEAETVVLALRGDDEQWFVAGDWRANSTLDSVHDDGGWIVGWMPYEVPAAQMAAAPQAHAAPAEPVTPPVIDQRAMRDAFYSATAVGKSFNDALCAAACATIWKRAARADGAPNAVPAAMSAIATECALHAEERHSYLPNTPAQAATWRPHDWVLQAMSRAISFDHMMNQAAPAVDAPALTAIKGAWIDGGYVIVTPAAAGQAKAVKAAILAALPVAPDAAQAQAKGVE
ncbi:hypothetical protein [Delftia acidovorans]|uniref:hypothetical protein n=1 Tax=Delftia acidovorans TaxID=80866 RepID=UPI00192C608F|nr:hypothetical protein [Delftia acidovorans]